LTLTNVQPTNSGFYSISVSNSEGLAGAKGVLTVIAPPPYFSQATAAGPLAYWRLNETSGATAYDSVGGYNGTNNGGLVLGVNGPIAPSFPGFESGNSAYQFNATDSSVSVPPLNLSTNFTNITFVAWVN